MRAAITVGFVVMFGIGVAMAQGPAPAPAEPTVVKVGDMAPDFNLPGTDGKNHKLSDYRGKQAVVIAWFPKAFTGGCTIECKSLADNGDKIKKWRAESNVHPALDGGCDSCHKPHGSANPKLLATGEFATCMTCHEDKKAEFTNTFVHKPVESGDCAACHNPHASENAKLLTDTTDKVCMRCHGLGFSLDALADAELVARNFRGAPARRVESIRFATELRFELEGKPPPAEALEESR